MLKPNETLYSIQQMIIDLSLIDRAHYLAGTDKHENDVEHSMAVAVLCWYIHDKYKIDLDIAKILKYAISHDFVERYAGDVNTFANKEARKNKEIAESKSMNKLTNEFNEFNDMVAMMNQYETRNDEESLFVWTVDKMQQLIMGYMDNWRPYAELPVTYNQFMDKYTEILDKSSKYCKDIFSGLIEYSKTTYYDKP